MNEYRSPHKKTQLFVLATFIVDIILCMIILILLAISLHQSYQGRIYHEKYVEHISILSSSIGFFLAAVLSLKRTYFGSSFQGALLFLKICILGGLFHIICALALIFYFASHQGWLQIILGFIYRDYGYVQLINALFYLVLFVYFLRGLSPSTGKG